jgi:hypothetical protein
MVIPFISLVMDIFGERINRRPPLIATKWDFILTAFLMNASHDPHLLLFLAPYILIQLKSQQRIVIAVNPDFILLNHIPITKEPISRSSKS